jgi:hypothetical protein
MEEKIKSHFLIIDAILNFGSNFFLNNIIELSMMSPKWCYLFKSAEK